MTKKFYITTPIYYVNAHPHIGHAYTTIACDTIARRHRMLGDDTWFLTGTDEHGQKIERAAQAANKTPQQFTDEISAEFRALWDRMGLKYDDFIRTTSARHKEGVQALWRKIRDNGYIYKGTYTGQYCVSDELYVDAEPGAPCPDCGRPTETVHEENYYFKLSAFQDQLIRLYTEHPDFIRPETRRNEVLAFVRGGLRDLSISRSTFSWGIPVPDDPKHVVYVWLDALANYITALGYGQSDTTKFKKYWPADVHMIGKEIVRFHCVYWPAFLLAAGLPLPKGITAHGWLLFEESKMSKSRGNIVRAETIVDVLGTDALRYFLLREVVFGQDGSFSFDALVQRYNSDLANGLGNLASRTLTMINRYFKGEIPYPSNAAHTPADAAIAEAARQSDRRLRRPLRPIPFLARARNRLGTGRRRGQIHSRKRTLVPRRKKGRRKSRPPGHRPLHQRRSSANRDRASVSRNARRHRKNLGPARIRRHPEIRPDAIAVGTAPARHKVRRDSSRVSQSRQISRREDAENGRTSTRQWQRSDERPASPAKRSEAASASQARSRNPRRQNQHRRLRESRVASSPSKNRRASKRRRQTAAHRSRPR